MIKWFVAIALAAASLAGVARGAPLDVAYDIRPVLTDGALTALAVELRFAGDEGGQTRLAIPPQTDRHPGRPDLAGLEVSGASMTRLDATHVLLRHAPGGRILVRYRIVSGFTGLPDQQPFRALLLPNWFAVNGERAFVRPEGRGAAAASVRFSGLPKGWTVASDLTGATVGDLDDREVIGGAGWAEVDRPIDGARLRLFYRPELAPKSVDAGAGLMARIAEASFAFWGDPAHDLFVPVIPLRSDTGGRGIRGGFVINAGPPDDLTSFGRIFAHEHGHSWISRQIGGQPAKDSDLEAWLNEGFTDLTAARVMLAGGFWTLEDYAADLNAALLRYGTSPVRDAPNARIQAARATDIDVNFLAYDRGRLLGLQWDRAFRAATRGKAGLQDVLQRQRGDASLAKAQPAPTSADRLFPIAVREVTGLDIAPDIARYVDAGAPIELRADLLGECGSFQTVTQPVFDRGFDILATFRNHGQLNGLEAGGPAERAGLRDGDQIAIDELPSHDSQRPLTYRVLAPDNSRRAVTYKPEGQGTVSFQRFTLNPTLGEAGRERCRRVMSGVA